MTQEVLWGKMYAIKLLIFDDDELVEEVYNLNTKLQLLDEVEAQKEDPKEQIEAIESGKPDKGLTSMSFARGIGSLTKKGTRVIGKSASVISNPVLNNSVSRFAMRGVTTVTNPLLNNPVANVVKQGTKAGGNLVTSGGKLVYSGTVAGGNLVTSGGKVVFSCLTEPTSGYRRNMEEFAKATENPNEHVKKRHATNFSK